MASPALPFVTADPALRSVRSAEDVSNLADQAQTGLFVVQDDRIAYANAMFAELVGWPADELIGRQHTVTTAPEFRDHAQTAVTRRLEGKSGRPGQVRCLRRDGTQFDARVYARLIEFAGRPRYW